MLVEHLLAPNPSPMTLSGTNTYLVADQGTGEVAVIDPGPDISSHVEHVLARARALGRLRSVLVTHRHGDHLPAGFAVCAASGARLLGHAELPGVQRAVDDGEVVFAGLRALATPGHTRESLCFWEPSEGALFTGDLVAGSGTVMVDDTPGALADYIGSLERLRSLSPRTIYPGHGPRVRDAMAKLDEYLAHRRAREQQVLDALADSGSASVDELVARIYPEVSPELAPMAGRNVRACLDKLTSEGRTVADGPGRWRLAG
ncbi:MAG: MBL fold metallo-hydrolase [Chloroflexota bacterium]|nr:MBL fold metallo-hydrolase [Chloroflexota bacterium]